MRFGALRKHKNNTDVAIEVLKCFFVREKRVFKIKVRWYDIGVCHPPRDMRFEQRLELTVEQWRDWQPYFWYPPEPGAPKNCERAFADPLPP